MRKAATAKEVEGNRPTSSQERTSRFLRADKSEKKLSAPPLRQALASEKVGPILESKWQMALAVHSVIIVGISSILKTAEAA